jgi:hypothetical protein
MRYMPHTFKIQGFLNGSTVFDFDATNPLDPQEPNDPPPAPLIGWAGIGAIGTLLSVAIAIYEASQSSKKRESYRKKKREEYYPSGVMKSRESDAYIDPTPIDITFNNQTYTVDEWGISFKQQFSEQDGVQQIDTEVVEVTSTDTPIIIIESLANIA